MDYKPIPIEITLEPLVIKNADALTSISLLYENDQKQAALVYSLKGQKESDPALALYSLALEKNAQPELIKTIPEAGFIPEWDIIRKDKKTYSLIYNDARGFTCPLILDELKIGETGTFSGKLPYGSFSGPAFIKGSGEGAYIISAIYDFNKLMVFKPDKTCKEVCKANYARILPRDGGYLVFIKTNIDGAAKNNVSQGTVCALRTDKDFDNQEKVLLPFEDMSILEFSATEAGDLFILFATTMQGYVVYGFTTGNTNKTLFYAEIPWDKYLSRPEIIIRKRTALIAVIESPTTPACRVLTAKWDIARLIK